MPRSRYAAALLLGFIAAGAFARETDEQKARKKEWEEAQAAFDRDYRSEDPAVRRAAVQRLGAFTEMGSASLVIGQVLGKEKHPGVLEAAVQVISRTSIPEEVRLICEKAVAKGDWPVRAVLAEALGYLSAPSAADSIRALLKSEKDPRVLTMAIFGVAQKRMADAIDMVIPLLEHEDWQVRVAVIETLATLKDEKGLMPLIDRLMNERGRLRQDIADALKKMTGRDYGRDANKWRQWFFERDKMPPDPPAPPPGAPAAPKNPDDPHGSAVRDEPTYFGIRVVSDRVLFILDVSLSMKTPIDIDKMKMAREAALTGDQPEEDRDSEQFEQTIEWWKIKDRLDLAKAQLKFVIKNLDAEQAFEIVTFSEKVQSWNAGALMKASARAKAKAIQYIDQVAVEGATAAGAALDFGFEMAGPGAADKSYKTGVDTIFFLSDGAPTDRPEDQILEDVRSRNRLRKIKVHVVAIVNQSVRFLRLLAEQNGGTYKFFKVEDKQ